jgi:hypothetical protein
MPKITRCSACGRWSTKADLLPVGIGDVILICPECFQGVCDYVSASGRVKGLSWNSRELHIYLGKPAKG